MLFPPCPPFSSEPAIPYLEGQYLLPLQMLDPTIPLLTMYPLGRFVHVQNDKESQEAVSEISKSQKNLKIHQWRLVM